jgi:exonuclease III
MRFGTWNVMGLYMTGSLITVAREIPKYKLDLVEVQEVKSERGGIEPEGYYTFFCGNTGQNQNINVANRKRQ